jgi:acyl-CoA thioester hydrolase
LSIREPGTVDLWPERVTVEGERVRTAFRVRYAETDQMGMAYYANYLVWFEVMRGDFMRARGIPYSDLEKQGYILPIIEAHVRYRTPAHYDDAIEIVAWVQRLRSRKITFEYRVERGSELLATGWTTHVPADRHGRPRAFSGELMAILGDIISQE